MYLPVYIQEIPTIKLTIKLLKIHVKFNIKNTIHVLAKINLIYLFFDNSSLWYRDLGHGLKATAALVLNV